IGVNVVGSGRVNNQTGVRIIGGAHANTVGGTAAGAGNLISGNNFAGVSVSDPGTNGNVVAGNTIGPDASGTGVIPNARGILIANGAAGPLVGGTSAGARNVISGNRAGPGLRIEAAGANTVQGNFIGVDAGGGGTLPNSVGIEVTGAGSSGNVIGGATA